MKSIVPALNKLQLACQDREASLAAIGQARKELFVAIREAITDFAPGEVPNITPAIAKFRQEYLAKFDKLNGE